MLDIEREFQLKHHIISPGSKTSRLLYSSAISCGSTPTKLAFFDFKISNSSSTFLSDIRLILVCHEVEPVPVETHNPELFVFVIFCDVLGRI